jgi:hypothetical protein
MTIAEIPQNLLLRIGESLIDEVPERHLKSLSAQPLWNSYGHALTNFECLCKIDLLNTRVSHDIDRKALAL